MSTDYDVIILGAGAAGLSTALYTSRAMLKTLVIEQLACGGQIMITDMIENYPGFPEGIRGPELSQMFEQQSRRFGTEVRFEQVTGLANLNQESKIVYTTDGSYTAKTIVVATGGSHNKLVVPGEEEYSGRGVSYCAVCDGNFFKGQNVVVVGGGDAALDEGHYLAGIVDQVTIVHRRDELRATKVLQDRAFNNSKFKFLWSHVVEEIVGNGVVEAVRVKDLKKDEIYDYPTAAVFIYIGFHSNSDFMKDTIPLDETGHVYTDISMQTNIPGVYACGDIRVNSDRQLGSAVGDGIVAALAAYRHISEG